MSRGHLVTRYYTHGRGKVIKVIKLEEEAEDVRVGRGWLVGRSCSYQVEK